MNLITLVMPNTIVECDPVTLEPYCPNCYITQKRHVPMKYLPPFVIMDPTNAFRCACNYEMRL